MKRLTDTRCFNHHRRESAARCPQCGRHYCRECVTEHEGRLLCASCLAGPEENHEQRKRFLAGLSTVVQLVFAVAVFWMAFSLVGSILLSVPSAFHEMTIFDW